MEITNEIKAKVFAQYLGHNIKHYQAGNLKLVGASITDQNECCTCATGKNLYKEEDCQLILKPISAITDEDAIEIYNTWQSLDKDNKPVADWCKKSIQSFSNNRVAESSLIDLLRYYGYDTPNILLGNQTLHEAGLAIYE